MNYGKTVSIVALSIVATMAITTIAGFDLDEVIADESSEKKYTFANSVEITGVFSFANGESELVTFEVFTQDSGFKRSSEQATLSLEKELDSSSPLLYDAADKHWKYGEVPGMDYMTEFDLVIYMAQDSLVVRQFDYVGCTIDDYKVETLHDKEEGWTTSKGFAPIDKFDLLCEGYSPSNPLYENMNQKTESQQTSTLDLIEADKARKAMSGQ